MNDWFGAQKIEFHLLREINREWCNYNPNSSWFDKNQKDISLCAGHKNGSFKPVIEITVIEHIFLWYFTFRNSVPEWINLPRLRWQVSSFSRRIFFLNFMQIYSGISISICTEKRIWVPRCTESVALTIFVCSRIELNFIFSIKQRNINKVDPILFYFCI